MAKTFSMHVLIMDIPGESEAKGRIELTSLPEDMEHFDAIVEAFERMWPALKTNARTNVERQINPS